MQILAKLSADAVDFREIDYTKPLHFDGAGKKGILMKLWRWPIVISLFRWSVWFSHQRFRCICPDSL